MIRIGQLSLTSDAMLPLLAYSTRRIHAYILRRSPHDLFKFLSKQIKQVRRTLRSSVLALLNVSVSGPCGVMQLCSEPPPGTKPVLASYLQTQIQIFSFNVLHGYSSTQ